MPIILLIILILVILLVVLGIRFQRKRTREKLQAAAFNPAWVLILQNNLALYSSLPDTLKHKLHGLINAFLYEKTFSGFNGLEINDEIRVTIAAQACMLLLNRDDDFYPSLKNIFVYPGAFKSMQTRSDGMVNTVEETVRIGESWQLGQVVLSWQHSMQGAMNSADGQNVVYHEFAHQLDHADGAIDGTPVLDSAENYASWSKVFSEEYTRLRDKIAANKKTLIDDYGAVSEGEFFAVVTELFFERPVLLEKEHPELYEELRKFYRLNPVEWF
ncbi:MAG: zinc-dependent peptidase [Gammaproteobacteria bacterium]|nr:zinc-dependent peptidase [Gammaproteobacteria bacterium]